MTFRTVQKGGVPIHLTPTEYRVLCLLAANEGKVLTYLQILTDISETNRLKDEHYLRVYMGNLRHKLENEPARPQHLLTEPAVGYRLVQKPRH
jgi:two-component system, OmpR family, KDP operon response regulator KdpE